ncbi:hypothetical protein FNW39_05500 [Escherichia coli]|nr:hypothetical protein [Escherichia coli]EFB5495347.1 hypothetical protein [Escherichia coli]EFB5537695.1 hypothetical protein [Escherichia coli]MBG0993685.1 hypothetical protein [Escherichia coli]QSR40632.1 hypothetical protein GJV83_19895 [Escherichia coli]
MSSVCQMVTGDGQHDALPVVRKASWHCRQCHHDYYGEQYCTHCQTGGFSIPRTTQEEICEF